MELRIHNFPETMLRQVKVRAQAQKKTIKEIIEKAVEEYLQNEEKEEEEHE